MKQKLYDEYSLKVTEDIRRQAESSISSVAVQSRDFLMSPRSNVYISDCQEQFIPNVIRYNAFNVHRFEVRPFVSNPLLNRNEEVNWSFIMVFIISLVALLLSFDAISGERESKTLSLCLSNGVSRAHIFLAKWLSIIIVLIITLFVSVLLSLLIQMAGGTLVLNLAAIFEVLLFFGIASILSALMTCLGLLCSVICSKSNVSLLCAISLWLVFALIIPNTSILWADKLVSD